MSDPSRPEIGRARNEAEIELLRRVSILDTATNLNIAKNRQNMANNTNAAAMLNHRLYGVGAPTHNPNTVPQPANPFNPFTVLRSPPPGFFNTAFGAAFGASFGASSFNQAGTVVQMDNSSRPTFPPARFKTSSTTGGPLLGPIYQRQQHDANVLAQVLAPTSPMLSDAILQEQNLPPGYQTFATPAKNVAGSRRSRSRSPSRSHSRSRRQEGSSESAGDGGFGISDAEDGRGSEHSSELRPISTAELNEASQHRSHVPKNEDEEDSDDNYDNGEGPNHPDDDDDDNEDPDDSGDDDDSDDDSVASSADETLQSAAEIMEAAKKLGYLPVFYDQDDICTLVKANLMRQLREMKYHNIEYWERMPAIKFVKLIRYDGQVGGMSTNAWAHMPDSPIGGRLSGVVNASFAELQGADGKLIPKDLIQMAVDEEAMRNGFRSYQQYLMNLQAGQGVQEPVGQPTYNPSATIEQQRENLRRASQGLRRHQGHTSEAMVSFFNCYFATPEPVSHSGAASRIRAIPRSIRQWQDALWDYLSAHARRALPYLQQRSDLVADTLERILRDALLERGQVIQGSQAIQHDNSVAADPDRTPTLGDAQLARGHDVQSSHAGQSGRQVVDRTPAVPNATWPRDHIIQSSPLIQQGHPADADPDRTPTPRTAQLATGSVVQSSSLRNAQLGAGNAVRSSPAAVQHGHPEPSQWRNQTPLLQQSGPMANLLSKTLLAPLPMNSPYHPQVELSHGHPEQRHLSSQLPFAQYDQAGPSSALPSFLPEASRENSPHLSAPSPAVAHSHPEPTFGQRPNSFVGLLNAVNMSAQRRAAAEANAEAEERPQMSIFSALNSAISRRGSPLDPNADIAQIDTPTHGTPRIPPGFESMTADAYHSGQFPFASQELPPWASWGGGSPLTQSPDIANTDNVGGDAQSRNPLNGSSVLNATAPSFNPIVSTPVPKPFSAQTSDDRLFEQHSDTLHGSAVPVVKLPVTPVASSSNQPIPPLPSVRRLTGLSATAPEFRPQPAKSPLSIEEQANKPSAAPTVPAVSPIVPTVVARPAPAVPALPAARKLSLIRAAPVAVQPPQVVAPLIPAVGIEATAETLAKTGTEDAEIRPRAGTLVVAVPKERKPVTPPKVEGDSGLKPITKTSTVTVPPVIQPTVQKKNISYHFKRVVAPPTLPVIEGKARGLLISGTGTTKPVDLPKRLAKPTEEGPKTSGLLITGTGTTQAVELPTKPKEGTMAAHSTPSGPKTKFAKGHGEVHLASTSAPQFAITDKGRKAVKIQVASPTEDDKGEDEETGEDTPDQTSNPFAALPLDPVEPESSDSDRRSSVETVEGLEPKLEVPPVPKTPKVLPKKAGRARRAINLEATVLATPRPGNAMLPPPSEEIPEFIHTITAPTEPPASPINFVFDPKFLMPAIKKPLPDNKSPEYTACMKGHGKKATKRWLQKQQKLQLEVKAQAARGEVTYEKLGMGKATTRNLPVLVMEGKAHSTTIIPDIEKIENWKSNDNVDMSILESGQYVRAKGTLKRVTQKHMERENRQKERHIPERPDASANIVNVPAKVEKPYKAHGKKANLLPKKAAEPIVAVEKIVPLVEGIGNLGKDLIANNAANAAAEARWKAGASILDIKDKADVAATVPALVKPLKTIFANNGANFDSWKTTSKAPVEASDEQDADLQEALRDSVLEESDFQEVNFRSRARTRTSTTLEELEEPVKTVVNVKAARRFSSTAEEFPSLGGKPSTALIETKATAPPAGPSWAKLAASGGEVDLRTGLMPFPAAPGAASGQIKSAAYGTPPDDDEVPGPKLVTDIGQVDYFVCLVDVPQGLGERGLRTISDSIAAAGCGPVVGIFFEINYDDNDKPWVMVQFSHGHLATAYHAKLLKQKAAYYGARNEKIWPFGKDDSPKIGIRLDRVQAEWYDLNRKYSRRLTLVNNSALHATIMEPQLAGLCHDAGVEMHRIQQIIVYNFGNATIVFGSAEEAYLVCQFLLKHYKTSGLSIQYTSDPCVTKVKVSRDPNYVRHLERMPGGFDSLGVWKD